MTAPAPQAERLDRQGASLLWQQRALHGYVVVAQNKRFRWLEFGDAVVQSAFSRAHPELLVLPYTQWLLAPMLFRPDATRAAMLGLGGGSVVSHLHRHGLQVEAVEHDPMVVEACRQFFPCPLDAITLYQTSAEDYLRACKPQSLDVLLVDLYTGGTMSEPCMRPAFHDLCRQALADDGVLSMNTAPDDAELLDSTLHAVRAAFDGQALALAVPGHGNVIIVGLPGKRSASLAKLQGPAATLQSRLGLPFERMLSAIFAAHGSRGRLRFDADARRLGLPR